MECRLECHCCGALRLAISLPPNGWSLRQERSRRAASSRDARKEAERRFGLTTARTSPTTYITACGPLSREAGGGDAGWETIGRTTVTCRACAVELIGKLPDVRKRIASERGSQFESSLLVSGFGEPAQDASHETDPCNVRSPRGQRDPFWTPIGGALCVPIERPQRFVSPADGVEGARDLLGVQPRVFTRDAWRLAFRFIMHSGALASVCGFCSLLKIPG